jgi:tetratricopeptide (TPR) repeat protein/GTPase SAR1 family protein
MNTGTITSPKYIRRAEEDEIERQLAIVKAGRQSRAVLLYGPGGVGKTSLVRHMSDEHRNDGTVWLEPFDVDDPDCWLLSNLETRIVRRLQEGNSHFAEFWQALSRLPSSTHSDISHETIVSYLNRIKEVFAGCYNRFVAAEKKTVVIVFDTVETIRGTNLLLTLAQWMKALPVSTLFILSGRPLDDDGNGHADQIESVLAGGYQTIEVTTIEVGGFSRAGTREYIQTSRVYGDLQGDEEDKLVLLSRGHPLWLAFMLDYLQTEGIPPEVSQYSVAHLESHLPFGEEMTTEGLQIHAAFLRRLVAPYQSSAFWPEAIKRLAIVRQPVAIEVWQQLMNDLELPDDIASLDEAWDQLLSRPWIRPRGNRRFVTLHDAVAEEFALRLFPLHDHTERWRNRIWRRALNIYRDLASASESEVEPRLAELDAELRRFDASRSTAETQAPGTESVLMEQSVRLDAGKRQLDQLKAASLYYLFLTDYEDGCRQLLDTFAQAESQHDLFFQDLLVLYLQRFLPGGSHSEAFNDVIRAKLVEFRRWLAEDRPDLFIALGLMVGRYLVEASQSEEALKFLAELPEASASVRQVHELYLLRGNACLRAPGLVRDGIDHFTHAINHAEGLETPDRHKFIAEAYKERGFYYRNTGQWTDADLSYQHAWETIIKTLSADSPVEDRYEMASIQTNWAYVKGLSGSYRDGLELAESAITMRRQLGLIPQEGLSHSVCGEVYRYARRFEMAWAAYGRAEMLLQGRRNWGRLGFVLQEQAICLYQAHQEGISIGADPLAGARERIVDALDLCVAHAIRGYPSALNRAGRIFGSTDPDAGLKYLEDGIAEAQRIADGWFWFANLVEYAEMCYRQWRETGQAEYRLNISAKVGQIDQVAEDFSFSDLRGRWSLIQAHLIVHDYLDSIQPGEVFQASAVDGALARYEAGFVNIAKRPVGSSGAASLRAEFAALQAILTQLPEDVQTAWQAKLRSAWAAAGDVSMVLLARLEELYKPAA